MSYRFLLTTGGTGGHIFPALALARELKEEKKCSILFAGGRLSSNAYFNLETFHSKDIACSGAWLKGAFKNMTGVVQAIKVLSDYSPDAVIGFGSYYTLPVLTAAYLLEIPILLHEANSIPGRVNRLFSPCAEKTWIFFSEAKKQLQGLVEECKMPLRAQFRKGNIPKKEALAYFQLDDTKTTLLVFGGSQGAKVVNALFSEAVLIELKKTLPPFQVIHFTGAHEEPLHLSHRYAAHGIQSYVKPFEERMDMAWAAADMAVTRAGACSVAEQYEYEVRGVVIPFRQAADGHQESNADKLIQAGLALKLKEEELTGDAFVERLRELLQRQGGICPLKQEYELSDRIIDWMERR